MVSSLSPNWIFKGRFSEFQMLICNIYWFSMELLLSWTVWYSIFWGYSYNVGEWFPWVIPDRPTRTEKTANFLNRHSQPWCSPFVSANAFPMYTVQTTFWLSPGSTFPFSLNWVRLRCLLQVEYLPSTLTVGVLPSVRAPLKATSSIRLPDSPEIINILPDHFLLHVIYF